MLTIVTNGVPSAAQPVTVAAATLACPPPGCDDRRARLRLGPIHVTPRHVELGQAIEATTTVTAGSAEVFDLIVLLYDGAPEENGTIVAAQRIAHLPAHGDAVVRVSSPPRAAANAASWPSPGRGFRSPTSVSRCPSWSSAGAEPLTERWRSCNPGDLAGAAGQSVTATLSLFVPLTTIGVCVVRTGIVP